MDLERVLMGLPQLGDLDRELSNFAVYRFQKLVENRPRGVNSCKSCGQFFTDAVKMFNRFGGDDECGCMGWTLHHLELQAFHLSISPGQMRCAR